MSANPTASIASALERDGGDGIVIVYYPDLGLREWLAGEVEMIAGVEPVVRVNSVDDALAHPEALVLIFANDERALVEDLDGSRDRFLEPRRKHPVVAFLLRDGEGARALAEAPSLAGWVRGSDPDPEKMAEVDVVAARREFEDETGEAPAAWLVRWRNDEIPKDARSLSLSYRATLLEGP